MEVVLLWLDNLDDLVGALRLRAHALLSFSGALALFALTVFAVMHWPWLLAVCAIAGLAIVAARAVNAAVATRLNSDP